MNYMKSAKQTLINWAKENKVFAYILVGAIGLPVALGIGGLVLSLLIFILTLIGVSTGIAIAIVTLSIIGALGGAAAYYYFEE